jgi:hypothetical protein
MLCDCHSRHWNWREFLRKGADLAAEFAVSCTQARHQQANAPTDRHRGAKLVAEDPPEGEAVVATGAPVRRRVSKVCGCHSVVRTHMSII